MNGLLERHAELDALGRRIAAAKVGQGAVAVVLGEAGVGKTRLLEATRGLAEEGGLRVFVARGAELESSFPFGLVRQLLEPPLAGLIDGDREAAFAGAARLARDLFEHPEFKATPLAEDVATFAALHGLYWLVANLADRGPMALLVDDAHWADPASLRFVDYLARRVSGLPLALVVAARSGEPAGVEERLLGLESSAGASVLHPPPLSARAVGRRVRERLRAEPDEAFSRACFEATGGNPLFLEELLREVEAGDVEPTAEAALLVGEVGPDAVARLTLTRLDAIGPEARELARAVAVLGDGTEPGLAAGVAGLSDETARVATDRLAAAGILAPERRLRFVHPIVRAAIYHRLLPGERAARHAHAAAHLARAGAPAERIAAHLLLTAPAGDPTRVAELAEAARIARARGAPESAAAYLRRALEEPPPEGELHGLLLEMGRIEHDLHDYAAAEEHVSGALRSPALAVRAEAARWLARTLMSSGRPDEAIARFDAEIEALAGEASELALGLESELLLAAVWSPGHQPKLGTWLERFERRGAGLPRFEAVAGVHRALRRMLEGATATEVGDRTEAALATGAIDSLDPTFGWALRLLLHSEREEAGLALLEPALARARELGHLSQVQLLCAQRAQFIYAQGRIAEALAEAETGLNAGEGFHPALPLLHAVRLDALRERGELDEAEAGLRRAGLAGEVADRPPFGWLLASRCRLRLAQGRLEEARADFVRGEVLHERLGVSHIVHPDWRAYGAIAVARLGQREQAEEVAGRQLERARFFDAPRALGTALWAAALVKGGEAGLAHLEEAVAVLDGSSARLVLAQALSDYGTLLRELGGRRKSHDPLRRAITLADECGAPVLAERARAELTAGGGRPPPGATGGVAALTPAERRVAMLAAQGSTNREIAQTLFVTEKTVEFHLTHAYRKLGIRSRWQLAEFAGRTDGEPVGAR
jgi:DNA-binding CsgD family transcriptional regulator